MRWILRFKRTSIAFHIVVLYIVIISCYKVGREATQRRDNSLDFLSRLNHEEGEEEDAATEPQRSWIPHLCPRYKPTNEDSHRQADLRRIYWENPSKDAIFFMQTSCAKFLSTREACAVESASKHHPHRPILVFMTSPLVDEGQPLMKELLSLPNVRFVWLDLDKVFRAESLREWHQQRQWMYNQQHASAFVSDAVRAILLGHYGGTYLDLDALTLRGLPTVTNWLARMDNNYINLAVASFVPKHSFMKKATESIPTVFDAWEKNSIGPALVTNILHEICPENITIPEDSTDSDTPEFCGDITIFPISTFYPMSYKKDHRDRMFYSGEGFGKMFYIVFKKAYSLHLYNSLTKNIPVVMGGDSVLEEVAKRNCPKVYDVVLHDEHYL